MTPTTALDPELLATLRRRKLGQLVDTLPERLALAKTNKLSHAEFLHIVLADEVNRRDTTSASRRARAAGLDPTMTLDRWDPTAAVAFDRPVFDELCSLRFVDSAHNAIVMGPVGVGKTFLANALGHIAVRRRRSIHFERARPSLQTAPHRAARQQPRPRAPQTAPGRRVDHQRLRALRSRRDRDRRLLRDRRRGPPARLDHRHLEPRSRRVARVDDRSAPRSIRRRPTQISRPRTRRRHVDGESYRDRQRPTIPTTG